MDSVINPPRYDDLVFDIGMHKGEDAEFYLRNGFRVVGFEAEPELVRFARNRLKEFEAGGRLTIVEGAIVDRRTIRPGQNTVPFYRNSSLSVWGTIRADWADRNQQLGAPSSRIDVAVVDLAAVIRERGMPHYMKIDIEGADSECLRVLEAFPVRPAYLSMESAKTGFSDIAEEIRMLVNLGYDAFQAVEQSGLTLQQFEEGSSGPFGATLGGQWKTRQAILRQYRVIRLGYYLLGDDGRMTRWAFPGAGELRAKTRRLLRRLTKAVVPGWYDTHARHSSLGRRRSPVP